jgi:hypothetical protein
MSESNMRSVLVRALISLDARAIESPSTGIGIPDVNYIGGWIECKWLEEWPRRADTHPVKFKHKLSKEQGMWLYRRTKAGGVALCCCQVDQDWFFFDGMTIKDRFDFMTRSEMELEALLHFRGMNGNKERLVKWLKSL